MKEVGTVPVGISERNALNSIGENIIIADHQFYIRWMNSNASNLLTILAPLYQLKNSEAFIGLNMDFFHERPEHQQRVMGNLDKNLRSRITIRNRFVTDIVVTPIKDDSADISGYIVMLMDVTTKAEEEKKKELLIKKLSIPILHVWENTIALPLIGVFDRDRAELLITSVLKECSTNRVTSVLIDLSGLQTFEEEVQFHIQKLYDCLKLIGTKCILVGIKPQLAISMKSLERDIDTYSTAHAGLKAIIDNK